VKVLWTSGLQHSTALRIENGHIGQGIHRAKDGDSGAVWPLCYDTAVLKHPLRGSNESKGHIVANRDRQYDRELFPQQEI
jgi:hypothetical protein